MTSSPLAAAGVRLTGIDVSPGMLRRLRAKRPDLPVAIALAVRPPFAAATFDAALLVHVLHLVADPASTLREIAAVLRPGGLVLRGRTHYTDSPHSRVHEALDAHVTALTGVSPTRPVRATTPGLLADLAGTSAVAYGERELARWEERTTGREMLRGLAERFYSTTWTIPDDVMPALLRRLKPEVDALLGGLDRDVVNEGVFAVEWLRFPTRSPSIP